MQNIITPGITEEEANLLAEIAQIEDQAKILSQQLTGEVGEFLMEMTAPQTPAAQSSTEPEGLALEQPNPSDEPN